MKKEVSSTTASTEAIIFGVAVSDFHGSLSWMLTTCTLADLPPLSVAWAKVCAASLACCTGSVMRLILGVSRRSSRGARSGEHTSDLQSLMRRSYAGFCMNKTTEREQYV